MTPRPPARLALAAAFSLAFVLGAAACSDDEPEDSGDGGGSEEEATIVAADFSLTDLTVAPGEEIFLQNDGDAPHTATADDGEFDLGEVAPGETSEEQTAPEEPGDYGFHCEIHEDMTATLTVEG